MLDTGDKAPEFTLPTRRARHLADGLLKDGPAILFFYPADFTPTCTREACSIRDIHTEISRAGLTVAGISPQSRKATSAFARKHTCPSRCCGRDQGSHQDVRVNGPLGVLGAARDLPGRPERVVRGRVKATFSVAEARGVHQAGASSFARRPA
jgi:peroxiredoxin Q/BCP